MTHIQNAIIESASIQIDRGSFLSPWLILNYGGSGQGFGASAITLSGPVAGGGDDQ